MVDAGWLDEPEGEECGYALLGAVTDGQTQLRAYRQLLGGPPVAPADHPTARRTCRDGTATVNSIELGVRAPSVVNVFRLAAATRPTRNLKANRPWSRKTSTTTESSTPAESDVATEA